MLLLHGPWRKLVFLPLGTLVLGWLVYAVGFTLHTIHTSSSSRFEHIPYYITTATPPLLVVIASLHAALFGAMSSILGTVAAILSVVCFSFVGYVLYTSALTLYSNLHLHFMFTEEDGLDAESILMFVGTLVTILSWSLVLMLWNCFPYQQPWTDNQSSDYIVDENGGTETPPLLPKNPPPFAGVARKLAALVLLLKAASWCVLVTGVNAQTRANSSAYIYYDDDELINLPFGTWMVSVLGVLLLLSATLHVAANGTASVLMGVYTSLLSMLYLTCIGHLVVSLGIRVHHRCVGEGGENCSISTFPRYELYQLCGGLGTCVFWAIVLSLWPFYFKLAGNARDIQRHMQQRYYSQGQELIVNLA